MHPSSDEYLVLLQCKVRLPRTPRYSLARLLPASGATPSEVQRVLRQRRLSTTGIYLTPNEDDLRLVVSRAGM